MRRGREEGETANTFGGAPHLAIHTLLRENNTSCIRAYAAGNNALMGPRHDGQDKHSYVPNAYHMRSTAVFFPEGVEK